MFKESFESNSQYFWNKIQEVLDKLSTSSITNEIAKEQLHNINDELIMIIKLEDSHKDIVELNKY